MAGSLAVVVGLCASPTHALTIILNFDNGQSASPGFDPDQSGLISLFQFAEQFYEDAIPAAHTLTINYWYQNLDSGTIGKHDLVAHDGLRETEADIKIDSNTNWFIDPSPSSNLEFNMGQTLWRDINSTQRSDWYNFGSSVIPQTFEVGFTGGATSSGGADNLTDMLSVVVHEVGHALGMSAANSTTVSQTSDGDYDFSVFGQALAVETANNSGDDNADIAHLENTNALMTPALPSGTRQLPSHTDLYAMSAGGVFPSLDLPRREFYGGGNWNTAGNWSGNSRPQSDDDAFVRDADGSGDLKVGLSANGFANNLTVSEDADIDTNGFKLDASNIITVNGVGSSIVIGAGGELEASQIQVQNGALISMLAGTLDTNTLLINTGTKLLSGLGNATVDVATSLTNNGTIQAGPGTMTLTSFASNPWNLDGIGNGVVDAAGGSIDIVSGGLQGNSFRGTMNIGQSRFISISVAWSLTSGGRINLTGGDDFTNSARIEGAQITLTTSNATLNATGFVDINAATVINNGTINTTANAELNFNSTTTVNGGVFNVDPGGVLNFSGGWTLTAGTLNLNGGASSTDAATVRGLSQTLRGTVNIDQTAAFDTPTTFSSTVQVSLPDFVDSLRLDNNAVISTGASFSGTGKLSNTLGSTLTLQDGANVGVRLDNNGLLEIGNSPGLATVAGFAQVLGTLHVELGGRTPGAGYDRLVVTGPTTLFGSLDIDLIDGLTPDYFDEFQVIMAGSRTGEFTAITGAMIDPDMTLAPVYDYNGNTGLTLIAALPGDANLDGIVNGQDLLAWQANLFSGNEWTQGDFNLDGLVSGLDLLIWQSHLFDSVALLIPSPSSAATIAVPEPSTLVGLMVMSVTLTRRRQTSHRA